MTDPAQLLAECQARGIRLLPGEGVALTIDAPASTVTPELVARLKALKFELLALLRPPADPGKPALAVAVCRCGSTTWRDVPIHDGQSLRRDCGRCGRFIDFPVWCGTQKETTRQKG
jgi:TubC N-terminal docking domain